jgi:hypothetical protein
MSGASNPAEMKRAVIGIVDTPSQAELTVRRLAAEGFAAERISVLYPDRHGDHDFAFEAQTKAPEGALAGIGLGAIVGAMVGIALGIVGVEPGHDALLEAGPVLTALAGAALGALVLGLVGAVIGARMPEIEARHYEGKVRVGTVLVGVHAASADEVRRAREILRGVAAAHVHAVGEAALPVGS